MSLPDTSIVGITVLGYRQWVADGIFFLVNSLTMYHRLYMIPSRGFALPSHASASHMHDDTLMINNPGSVLENTFSSHYRRIILFFRRCRVTILEDFDRSECWGSSAIFVLYFSNPIRLVLRLAATPRAPFISFKAVVNIYTFLSYSCLSACSSVFARCRVSVVSSVSDAVADKSP